MALTIDATASSSALGQNSLTFTHINNGNLLVLGVQVSRSFITSVSYGGHAMTQIATTINGNAVAALYYLLNPPTGANNIVISSSVAVNISGDSISFFGADSFQPNASITSTASAAESISNILTSTADQCLHLVAIGDDSFGISTVTGGTLISTTLIYSSTISPAGSHTITASETSGNQNWASVGAMFAPVSTTTSTSTSTTTTSTSTSTTSTSTTTTSTSTTTTSTSTSTTTTSTSTSTTTSTTTTLEQNPSILTFRVDKDPPQQSLYVQK